MTAELQKMHKSKKKSPDLILRNKNVPNFPHFFDQFSSFFTEISSFAPVFPNFFLIFSVFYSFFSLFLIFSLFSSFFGIFSSFFLYFPHFFSSFPHFFLASFFPLNFPQFPQKYFPIFNFFSPDPDPRIQHFLQLW